MTTTVSGLLCWRDFHPLEWQLASLHRSDRTFADVYEAATRSAQPDNLLRHVLTACALAKVDESGYFRPAAIKEPLSGILGRQVEIANFQKHLKAFIEPKRKAIL